MAPAIRGFPAEVAVCRQNMKVGLNLLQATKLKVLCSLPQQTTLVIIPGDGKQTLSSLSASPYKETRTCLSTTNQCIHKERTARNPTKPHTHTHTHHSSRHMEKYSHNPSWAQQLLAAAVDAVTLVELMLTAQLAASRVHAVTLAELTLAACCLLLLQPACSCCFLCSSLPVSLHLRKVIKPNAHFFSWEQCLTGYFP